MKNRMKDIIKYDLKALTGKEYSFIYCQYCKFKHRGFRLVYLFRKASQRKWNGFFYRYLYSRLANKMNIEIPLETSIGKGLTLGHPSGIVINKYAVLGENISISHGVTIGRVHSGKRQGVPTIGNHIFIGANASIVGGGKYRK